MHNQELEDLKLAVSTLTIKDRLGVILAALTRRAVEVEYNVDKTMTRGTYVERPTRLF